MTLDSSINVIDNLKCNLAQCQKEISSTNFIKCCMCNIPFHPKCAKSSTRTFSDKLHCENCLEIHEIERYNPYYDTITEITDNLDSKHFNDDPVECIYILEEMSCILESCKAYTVIQQTKLKQTKQTQEFNKRNSTSKSNTNIKLDTFSCKFTYIDENATNFDSLAVTLANIDHKFDIVGLAETNVTAENKDLYVLDGYTSLYQDKIPCKKKGSGVALYISKEYVIEKMVNESILSKDIETLFVKVSLSTGGIHTGVIYRPPGGDISRFNDSLSKIMKSFNNIDNVYSHNRES